MASSSSSTTTADPSASAATIQALFKDEKGEFSNEFVKVQAIFEHFDVDKDGFLNFPELSALQECTSFNKLDGNQYAMVCKTLQCQPAQGISLGALRLTYAAEGTNLDEDFEKVFSPKRHQRNEGQKKSNKEVSSSTKEKAVKKVEERIFEVGADGVDISE